MFFNKKGDSAKEKISFIKNNNDLINELKEKGIWEWIRGNDEKKIYVNKAIKKIEAKLLNTLIERSKVGKIKYYNKKLRCLNNFYDAEVRKLKDPAYTHNKEKIHKSKYKNKIREICKKKMEEFCTINQKYDYGKKEKETEAKTKREHVKNPAWEVPEFIPYTMSKTIKESSKSIMQPCYDKNPSKPENHFVAALEESKKVKWWFKNGVKDPKFFAVLHIEKGEEKGFYVDFIIQFKDGVIGLFDTKGWGTWSNEKAGPRHDGLYSYIQDENKKGKKLIGGIAVKSSSTWKYNDKKEYDYDENNPTYGWKVIDL